MSFTALTSHGSNSSVNADSEVAISVIKS
jgi:hypothetical protein